MKLKALSIYKPQNHFYTTSHSIQNLLAHPVAAKNE